MQPLRKKLEIENPWLHDYIAARDNFLLDENKINVDKQTKHYINNIEITDLIDSLPVNPNRKWARRDRSLIKMIIVHQAVSMGSVEQINNYHITAPNHISEKGCPKISYHYFIDFDGKVFWCNELEDVTWHCKGKNTIAVGIVLRGNYKGPTHHGEHSAVAKKQKQALIGLLDYLTKSLKLEKKDIYGHCEIDKKNKANCPGLDPMSIINKYRNET